MEWNNYYIADFSNIHNVRYYKKGVPSKTQARELIDSYLGNGNYVILTGKELEELGIAPFRHTPFSKYLPKQRRSPRPDLRKKRKKLKGLVTHKFKAIWDELPTDAKSRHRLRLVNRTVITNKILK